MSKLIAASTPAWQMRGNPHVWMPYAQMQTLPLPVPVVRTEGVYWELADGRRLLDGIASWWTACHGYNHPAIVAAVAKQLETMPHIMFAGAHHEPACRLAASLAAILPGDLDYVFFSDSGSVAIEIAMKMALQYWRNIGQAARTRFLSFHDAYHGDTTGAMSICDPVDSMHANFAGILLPQLSHAVPTTRELQQQFEKVVANNRNELAAVVIEPLVQGAGGMRFHEPDVVAQISHVCQKYDVLLIADEVATGFGRTGSMFACQQCEIVPDIICLGKGLTGGVLGMAATVATKRIYDAFLSDDPACALQHGPTYMANPLACAAANASLELFQQEPRLKQVAHIEQILRQELAPCRDITGVVDVRCRGAIGVVQVAAMHDLQRVRQRFVEQGIWARPFRDIFYLTPAFVMSESELLRLCHIMVQTIKEWSAW